MQLLFCLPGGSRVFVKLFAMFCQHFSSLDRGREWLDSLHDEVNRNVRRTLQTIWQKRGPHPEAKANIP